MDATSATGDGSSRILRSLRRTATEKVYELIAYESGCSTSMHCQDALDCGNRDTMVANDEAPR